MRTTETTHVFLATHFPRWQLIFLPSVCIYKNFVDVWSHSHSLPRTQALHPQGKPVISFKRKTGVTAKEESFQNLSTLLIADWDKMLTKYVDQLTESTPKLIEAFIANNQGSRRQWFNPLIRFPSIVLFLLISNHQTGRLDRFQHIHHTLWGADILVLFIHAQLAIAFYCSPSEKPLYLLEQLLAHLQEEMQANCTAP